MWRLNKKGQSIIEYAVLIIIVMIVFFVMRNYISRGMQGRWKSSIDDVGEQYDPRDTNAYLVHTYESMSNSQVYTVPGEVQGKIGFWTNRVDQQMSTETKRGVTVVGTPEQLKE